MTQTGELERLNTYLSSLEERLTRYFDLERDKVLGERTVPLLAVFRQTNERYFVTKSIKVYGYENFEYVLVMPAAGPVSAPEVDDFTGYLVSLVPELVTPSTEHMSTFLTGVMVGSEVSPEAIAAVQRFAYGKSYAWGFKGWCDIRLVLVDLSTGEIYANKKGKGVRGHYKP